MSSISTTTLQSIRDRISNELGIYFDDSRLSELCRRLKPITKNAPGPEAESCLIKLAFSAWDYELTQELAWCLTVSETYFYRDQALWQYLTNTKFPSLLYAIENKNTPCSIWSAACCTGEEPYTAAMILDQIAREPARQVRIVATDLNERFIEQARKGKFNPWSLRTIPSSLQVQYFREGEKFFQLAPNICAMVAFHQFNLMNLATGQLPPQMPPEGFDIIFCSNVLIYFSPKQASAVLTGLHKCLTDGGMLITTPCDVELADKDLYSSTCQEGLFFLHKRSAHKDSRNNTRRSLVQTNNNKDNSPENQPAEVPSREDGASSALDEALKKSLPHLRAAHTHEPASISSAATVEAHERLRLIRTLADNGMIDESLELVEKAIDEFRSEHSFYYWRAVLLQQREKHDPALRSLQQAIMLKRDFVMAHFSTFMLLDRMERKEQASVYQRKTEQLLSKLQPQEVLPHSDGLSAGQLRTIIDSLRRMA